ncbi:MULTISPECIES: hypothetical protein [Lysinibacillus]|uniref:hypothetical protein n=1 Tax=Lysinibacillus TaxID=400634 RepID=UPI0021A82C6D|nr:hypothetical protein [Lysinibacillus capsici]MCT1539731.1 hypothetical protein [Lysinibacillus capsici]MCT1570801.1 hypothetical protein [Lysinibacillus capsici]MCT1648204.1 hypothetical protein [Lysinibacillus capsici]MCT1726746.1 hypothetical protein [Lysinibacillus capsici]MCT1783869.1 hypothetical protein [Lysinibacillus capsici]
MFIEKVYYKKNNGDVEEVNIDDIELREDFDIVKENIYCTYEECNCQMLYVPKGKRVAHFKTWPGENHSEECEAYFERIKERKPTRSLATSTARLTDEHIRNILREMGKTASETPEEREERLEKQRKKRKKKNPVKNNNQTPNVDTNIIPVTDDSADILQLESRAPRVSRRYSVNNLIQDDVGTALALREEISEIEIINNNYAVFHLESENGKTAKVYLEEAFFATAPLNIHSWLKSLEKIIDSGANLTLSCVGNVIFRNNELALQIFSENHLRVGDKLLPAFIMQYN